MFHLFAHISFSTVSKQCFFSHLLQSIWKILTIDLCKNMSTSKEIPCSCLEDLICNNVDLLSEGVYFSNVLWNCWSAVNLWFVGEFDFPNSHSKVVWLPLVLLFSNNCWWNGGRFRGAVKTFFNLIVFLTKAFQRKKNTKDEYHESVCVFQWSLWSIIINKNNCWWNGGRFRAAGLGGL